MHNGHFCIIPNNNCIQRDIQLMNFTLQNWLKVKITTLALIYVTYGHAAGMYPGVVLCYRWYIHMVNLTDYLCKQIR